MSGKSGVDFFDYNEPRLPFRKLGAELGARVQETAQLLAHAPDTPGACFAALATARASMRSLAILAELPPEAVAAFDAIAEALSHAERCVSEAAKARPLGRRSATPQQRRFEARAVVAVAVLQRLKPPRTLTREQAYKVVAAEIPAHLLSQRDYQSLTPVAQLAAWADAFGREEDETRQRALTEARGELWIEFNASWREPVLAYDGSPVLADTGFPAYGDRIGRDETDASTADVLAWLAKAKI